MSALDCWFRFRCSGQQLERWRVNAEAKGLPLSVWVRRALDSQAELEEALRRMEAAEQRHAARLHGLDPSEARRRDFDPRWRPGDDIQGGSGW